MINKTISIEELVDNFPDTVQFLAKKGIKCIACGEPIWGTLEEVCLEKNFTQSEISEIVKELKEILKK